MVRAGNWGFGDKLKYHQCEVVDGVTTEQLNSFFTSKPDTLGSLYSVETAPLTYPTGGLSECINWTHLALDSAQGFVIINTAETVWDPQNAGNSLTTTLLSVSERPVPSSWLLQTLKQIPSASNPLTFILMEITATRLCIGILISWILWPC